MESIEQLQDICKKVLRDIREIEIKRDGLNNDISAYGSKKALLENDIKALQEKHDNIQLAVKEEKKREIQAIEDKLREVADLKAKVETELATARMKEAQCDRQSNELTKSKDEYDSRLKAIAEKEVAINEKLKQIEEFQSRLRI